MESSDIQSGVENTHNLESGTLNDILWSNEPIENTPFRLIGNKEEGYSIVIGRLRVSDKEPTKEKALEVLDSKMWNVMVNTVLALMTIVGEDVKDTLEKDEPKRDGPW